MSLGIEYRYSERGPEPEPVSDNAPEPVLIGPPIPRHITNQRQFRIITESRARMDKAKSIALDKALAAMDALFNKRGPTMDNFNQKTQIADAIVTKFEPAAPGIYPGIPGEAYHGGPGLSKSGLDWALVSGQHYHYYQVEGNDQKQTAALREGRILHKVVLEFEDFNSEFVVEPEWPEDAINGAEQMKAIIQAYNENLEQKPAVEELVQAIEIHNAKLPKPIDAGKSVGEHEAAYELLPEAFQTLGEDDKRTATVLKACIKAYNDSLPKPVKTSGSYQAVLENYALLGIQQAERAAHISALPCTLPLNGTKAEMAERIRTFNPDAVFLDELKEQFMQEAGGREVLTANEYQHALRYREAVMAHPEAAVLLDEGVAESSLYWHHPETKALLKCRPDWMRPDHVLVDLKFVRNASPSGFARDGSAHNYHIQDAHYCDGYETLTGHKPSFVFVAVEKDGPLGRDVFKPILVGVYYYGQDDQRRALELRNMAVRNVVRWSQDNYWPGHDGMGEIIVPTYQANAERSSLNEDESGITLTQITDVEQPLDALPDNLFGSEAA
ncbi:PD-(D/E)XK nuclease-like domain-containing protein [Aeromonas sp. V90_14]|uniref:PD-(D/E)XK nuclease-like domain-containing protein n=1 Tax=Aeromonas sp. V90_14 TaxID=3044241 RepID=UPI00249DA8B1|nr:PD-(D/E)XK nuclease-like domain-containing protein [Aeromonas sp. V90_14]MDI3432364.1 PD-(D/E)XK nuclease-like domain-containing protein [Aeromonas sp. V90_14]